MSTVDPGQISESIIDSLPEPQLANNATTVLNKRYLRRDDDGVPIENIKQMFFRVANHIGQTDIEVREYYSAMINGDWMPNTPTLFNAGTHNGLGLSACYVVVPQDSLESICQTKTDLMMIQKSGGGVGYPFDNLRPKGTIVKSCGATTDGPIPFITTFCEDTNAIQQGAKRRGAQMGMLRIDHPDIWDFIHHKEDGTKWQNMNISPKVTSEFMKLVDTNSKSAHKVQHPKWGEGCIIQNEETGKVKSHNKPHEIPKDWSTVTTNQIFNRIIDLAWKNGEPGLAFWDRVEKDWVFKKSGKYRIVSTNPCGEIPLEDGGSCNLASINIAHMYKDGTLDWEWFADKVAMVVRFLDDVVEVNEFPVEKIAQVNKETRRIGVGVMGFADLLFQLKIPYDSKEAQDLASEISYELSETAYYESRALAATKGSFLAWEDSDYALESNEFEGSVPTAMRNAYRTMIAPTGTISIIANCSASIEPIFSLAFEREVMKESDGSTTKMMEVNPNFKAALEGLATDPHQVDLAITYTAENGTIRGFKGELSKKEGWGHLVEVFQTARDVSMEGHVLMQAAWQKHIDQACSKTVNLPEEATVEDVRRAYMLAWQNGCKGITVYRDNSREGVAGQTQPMKLTKKTDTTIESLKVDLSSVDDWFPEDNLARGEISEVPDICEAVKIKQNTPIGKIHVNVVHEGGDIKEIWGQIGKPGDQPSADTEAICRLASLVLRLGGGIDMVLKQLEHIGSSLLMPTAEGKIMSIPDGIAVAIKRARREIQNSSDTSLTSSTTNRTIRHRVAKVYAETCPDCGGKLHRNSGCVSCPSCGHNRC
jgi:ribonucleoside-diphosphate reductase alpha chain